jgi:hypothetical protein
MLALLRVLLVLAATAPACESSTPASASPDAGAFGAVCAEARHQHMQCVEPGQIVQGSQQPGTFDEDGCQLREQTKNSCCNRAQAGPRLLEGKCCYVFCDRSCC